MSIFIVTAHYDLAGGDDAEAVIIAVASSMSRAEEIANQHKTEMEELARVGPETCAPEAQEAYYRAQNLYSIEVVAFELDEYQSNKQ